MSVVNSVHPIDPDVVRRYALALVGERQPDPSWRSWWRDDLTAQLALAARGDERAANQLTSGLALALAQSGPVFIMDSLGLSAWEAQIERGIGMMMRPPARLFLDAGCPVAVTRVMPIRIDPNLGPMGGAWVPDRLIKQVQEMLDTRLDRVAVRLKDASYDPYRAIGVMREALNYAAANGLGLLEANDVFGPNGEAPFTTQVFTSDRTKLPKDVQGRIKTALKPKKEPGLFGRLLGRNGKHPEPVADSLPE